MNEYNENTAKTVTTELTTNYGTETNTSDVEKKRGLKGIENPLPERRDP